MVSQKILFIIPPSKSSLLGIVAPPFPPLDVLALASYLQKKTSNIIIKILDGQILNLTQLLQEIKAYHPSFVGINSTYLTHENSLILARYCKPLGAKVILGGHHATHLATNIIKNRGPYSKDYCIDAVCRLDGEEAMRLFISGEALDKIPNLAWSNKGQVKLNKIVSSDLNSLPFIDFELINRNDYYTKKRILRKNDKLALSSRIMPLFSRKGCGWRAISNKSCIFCSIPHLDLRYKKPERFWSEINKAQNEFKPEIIWDVADDFLDNQIWFKSFCNFIPKKKLAPKFMIHARADKITDEVCRSLKKLNVILVSIGFETGDETILRNLRKGSTLDENYRAIKLLSAAKIRIEGNFIFGGPGETIKTMESTLKFIKNLKEINPSSFIKPRLFAPFPGSFAWQMLLRKTGDKYKYQDNIDNKNVSRDWINNYTKITPQELFLYYQKVRASYVHYDNQLPT
ncbi:B12-binding domain-containing radical SAM protein [Patescibacteria group bacterium]|nr:B12-binding domain-containing radical SAM protein [Patescibacteria group bacterium]